MVYAATSAPFGTRKGLLESPCEAEQNEPNLKRVGAELMMQGADEDTGCQW